MYRLSQNLELLMVKLVWQNLQALELLVATAIMRKRGLSQEVYAEICALALLVHLEQPERLSLLTVYKPDKASS